MKAVVIVLGLSGVAALGAVKNWEAIKHASGPAIAMQKVQDISDAVAQKVEDVSAPVMQKIQDVAGTAVQTVSAAIDSWQDQGGQITANRSRAIVSGTDASAAPLVERSPVPTVPGAEQPQTLSTEPETSAATLVERSPAPAVNAERPLSTAPDVSSGSLFGVGDRLKVAFFERVAVEEDKWGTVSSASALSGIQQRPELSGEYTVQEDGTISVPLLGLMPVANRSAQQVQADLVETFEHQLGRKGLVNILSLERSPIYVLGPVKNPGSFKYAPGMTILHAIALAGGLNQGQSEPWQNIEAVRETQKRGGAIDAMVKLLARAAVLDAERDGTVPKIPPRLLELAGSIDATNLINEQSDRRKAVTVARKYRERATLEALETAKQDVIAYGHMDSLDELVKLRQERVNSTRVLVKRKVLSMTVLDQVQSELSDAEQRRREALNQYASARQRLVSLESQVLQARADARNDLEVEIEATDSQIAANLRELNASEGVLNTLPVTRAQFAAQFAQDANRVTYQIVRQSASGPVSIQSMGMTVLRPGDLVNITVGENQPNEPDGSSVQTSSPSGDSLPAASTLNEVGHGPVVAEQMIGPN